MFTAVTANAQVAFINENFDSFTTLGTGSLPQNGWTTKINPVDPSADPVLTVEGPNGIADKYIQAYSFTSPNIPFYLISPQIVAPSGGQTISVTTLRIGGIPGGNGTLEIGLVANPTDMSTFTSIGTITPISTATATNTTFNVPSSSYQYIAFKFSANSAHQALRLDNIVLTPASSLAVSDNVKFSSKSTQFAVTADNTALQFVAKKDPKNVQVYSALGTKVSDGKLNNSRVDISQLQSGVYFVLIEEADGTATKSKFIKK